MYIPPPSTTAWLAQVVKLAESLADASDLAYALCNLVPGDTCGDWGVEVCLAGVEIRSALRRTLGVLESSGRLEALRKIEYQQGLIELH